MNGANGFTEASDCHRDQCPDQTTVRTDTQPTATIPRRYPLFEHMSREHGLTLTDYEMDEIERVVLGMQAVTVEECMEVVNAAATMKPCGWCECQRCIAIRKAREIVARARGG